MKATCFDKYCVLVCVVPDTIRGLEHLPSCCIREIVNQCIMRLTRLEEQTCHKFQSRMTPCVLKEEKKKERISPYKWMLFSAAEFPFCINLTSHYHKPALPLLVASQQEIIRHWKNAMCGLIICINQASPRVKEKKDTEKTEEREGGNLKKPEAM